jgi:hypothetical protein
MTVLGLDHLIYGTPDLDAAVEEIAALTGVRPAYGGSHPGRGTRNALFSLGPDTYVEVIGPDPAQPPEAQALGGVRVPPQPRLVTWAAKCDDLEAAFEEARQRGLDLGEVQPMSRATPDGRLLEWRLTRGDLPGNGAIPFLIDWGSTAHPARSTPEGCSLIAFRAEHPQPDQVREWLAALDLDTQLPVEHADAPRLVAVLATPNGPVELS